MECSSNNRHIFYECAIVLTLFVCGCKKDYCPPISWTDYNWVGDVYYHFHNNDSELFAHDGDTLRVVGWLWKTHEQHPSCQYLTADKTIQYNSDMGILCRSPHILFFPCDYTVKETDYEMPLYITGIIRCQYEPGEPHDVQLFIYDTSLIISPVKGTAALGLYNSRKNHRQY